MDRKEAVLGAVARGWCSKKNEHKVMDVDLAEAITDEVLKLDIKPEVNKDFIIKALKQLNAGQISIIKNGIEQHGVIGHYGRNFIASVIMEKVNP